MFTYNKFSFIVNNQIFKIFDLNTIRSYNLALGDGRGVSFPFACDCKIFTDLNVKICFHTWITPTCRVHAITITFVTRIITYTTNKLKTFSVGFRDKILGKKPQTPSTPRLSLRF